MKEKRIVMNCMNCEFYAKGCEGNCSFEFPESMAISHSNIKEKRRKEIKRKHEKM